MIIAKAIEILLLSFSHINDASDLDRDTAIKLGIEALKLREKQLLYNLTFSDELLPGETPENEK